MMILIWKSTFPVYIILPDDMKRMIWDIIIVILVLYVALLQPLRIGFASDMWDSPVLRSIDVILDVFFLIDFLSCFFTAYVGDRGDIVASMYLIAKRFVLRLGFVADVLTAVPWTLIESTHIMSLSRIMLMSRTSRIVEGLRLVRIVRLRLIWSSFEDFFQLYHQYTEMISTFVFVIFMVHLNACFFTYVSLYCSLSHHSRKTVSNTHTHTTGSSHRTSRTNTLHGCNKQISTANHSPKDISLQYIGPSLPLLLWVSVMSCPFQKRRKRIV